MLGLASSMPWQLSSKLIFLCSELLRMSHFHLRNFTELSSFLAFHYASWCMSGISYSRDVSQHQDASMMENSSFWTGLEYGSALVYELLVHLIEFKFFVLLCSKFFRVQLSSDVFSFQLFFKYRPANWPLSQQCHFNLRCFFSLMLDDGRRCKETVEASRKACGSQIT